MKQKYIYELDTTYDENSALLLFEDGATKITSMESFMRGILEYIDRIFGENR